MLELIWKSTIVLVAAGIASVLLWRASAATRHVVWVLALGSLLILPVFEKTLSSWGATSVVYVPSAPRVLVASASVAAVSHQKAATGNGVAIAALGFWLTGLLVCLWRWKRAAAQVARMRRNAVALSDPDTPREIAKQFGQRSNVVVLVSPEEIVPLTAGLRHPFVLLPASAQQWSPERMRVVLLHEMAHIRRRDSFTQAIAELVRCLYWFHPLVWLAVSRIRVERERACDDLVLHAGTLASDYASHLLGLARTLPSAALHPLAVSMAGAHLETRIRAILHPRTNRRVMSRASFAAACIVAACLVLPLAAMRPQAANPGMVSGTVYDPAGARVPGASVIAIQTDNGQKLTATTDQEGKFSLGPLPEGPWQITVEARGFAPRTIEGVNKSHYDITLDVGQMQENVVVRAKGAALAVAERHRVRVGGNVVPAKLVYKVDPDYPEDVRSRGIEGNVVLRAVISMEGTILSLTSVSSPDPALTEAALKAVREWRYEPSLMNGEPIETATAITVNFQLEP